MNYRLIPNEALRGMMSRVEASAHAEISRAGAYSLYVLVRRHLNAYARAHHASSSRLGATPTRHIEDGSTAVVPPTGDTISIPIKGINRVFRPIDVYPKEKAALTIPINRISYGRRVSELKNEGWKIFRISTRGGGPGSGILFGKKDEGGATALYSLAKHVRLRQDRSILPSDETMSQAAARGAVRAILRRSAS